MSQKQSSYQTNEWYCAKCKCWFGNHIDIDYHENTIHPNFSDRYVKYWYLNRRKGSSPYD